MAASFGKRTQSQGPVQQAGNPAEANQKGQRLPSYYPPPGELYGTNPALLNIAMRRYLLEQSKQAQPRMGVAGSSGTNLLGGGLAGARPRLGAPILGGVLGSTGVAPNSGIGRNTLFGSTPLNARPVPAIGGYGHGAQQVMSGTQHGSAGGNQQPSPQGWVTATGPNGHKIAVHNGQWVDAQTGQPIR
ncbi:MAG TPA: hypothetical protein VK738_04360 [Terriglobales bacterium]|nr:hypothetical protein [Terriglobales bacterium]